MARHLLIAATLLGLAATPPPLWAQTACGNREKIVERLAEKYGEQHRGSGLQDPTRLVEVWISQSTGTWTLLFTRADGMACIAASGSDWLDYPPKLVAAGVDS
ncbi:MAG TPA: hypothetical protein PKA33_17875 [Amaricoccus sp.]|uniref:hypothetical protein n=1 Tax=Amaricoccus sp. TaxID=1872485 RepID=UPI002C31CD3E|nr:hypothetical protein [Amaricoccus sp.]HMQ93078.1 hypothetical protein [Amaricoccus sp.]HMR54239.1 hypothetical protein [Amaricoccus sp.]HMR60067.1 hypothetical protein [Amaricoccus sp.]HMU01217.1 hypothetical protein [Amaricoccus sp.]